MKENPIKMGTVFKRNMCLKDTRNYTESCSVKLEMAINAINSGLLLDEIRSAVSKFMTECASLPNAKYHYKNCIGLLEMVEEKVPDIIGEVSSYFALSVVPFCENLVLIESCINDANITDIIKQKILGKLHEYKIADRIIDNHNKLTKRFNVDDTIQTKYITIGEVCKSICNIVDTYNMPPHVKMEICFEEVCYQMDKSGIDFNESAMVESITDYFLSIPMDESSVDMYRKTILSSPVLSMKADAKIKYLMNENKVVDTSTFNGILENCYNYDQVKNIINEYKLNPNKSYDLFKETVDNICQQSPSNILEDIPIILKWIRTFAVNNISGPVTDMIDMFIQTYYKREDINHIIQCIEIELLSLEKEIGDTKTELYTYYKILEESISKLREYADSLYTEKEKKNQLDEGVHFEYYIIGEQDTKIVLNTLINDAKKADEFIDKISSQSVNTNNIVKSDIKDTITKENFTRYIDTDGRLSMVLCSFDTSACNEHTQVYKYIDSIISSTNNMLYNGSSKVYYTVMENCIDIVLRSKFKIATGLKEEATAESFMTDVELYRVNCVIESAKLMTKLEQCNPKDIIKTAIKRIGKLSEEQVSMMIEAWSMGAVIDTDDMDKFCNEFVNYQEECGNNVSAYMMKNKYKSAKLNRTIPSMDMMVESTAIMNDIIHEAVDLNSLKLAWMSAKKKAKGLSAKEQEMSRDMDASFNNFIRGLQNFYKVTDHREQIMKGQVIPSVSKMIKIGITLAISGVATGSILVPAIAAVTGIILSKKSKNKEKKMWLDEIDIELQVIDRELKRVEDGPKSNNKKYRTLLTMQKNLQREKQRIAYDLAKSGHSIIPSTKGIGGNNND